MDFKLLQMKRAAFVILFVFAAKIFGFSQGPDKMPLPPEKYRNIYAAKIVKNDTVVLYYMRPILIMPPPKFKTRREWIRYWRLVYNLKKIYPYLKLIHYYYYQVEATVQYMDEKERKKYLKQMERYLRKRFEKQLVNLTYTQGRLLIKLVDRETDHTTYDVIREFKGQLSADFWQAFARVFGTNLKTQYKPNKDDRLIEYILAKMDNGQL